MDGQDLSALFDAPKPSPAPAGSPGKAAAYHQYPACDMDWAQGFNVTRAACNNAPRKSFSYMVRVCCAGILGLFFVDGLVGLLDILWLRDQRRLWYGRATHCATRTGGTPHGSAGTSNFLIP